MKNLLGLILLTTLLSSCVNTGASSQKDKPQNERKIVLEERETVSDYKFTNDDLYIYNYIKDVLLQKHKVRIESEKDNDGNYVRKQVPVKSIVLYDETIIHLSKYYTYNENCEKSKKFISSKKGDAYNEAIDNFIINNQKIYSLSTLFQSTPSLISYKSIESEINNSKDPIEYWNLFYKIAPTSGGRLGLSRIGYNENKDTAVIEVMFMSGSMSGYVDYIFFNKSNTTWEVVDSLRAVYY